MSTNSRIGILIPSSDPTSSIDSAQIRSIYCHWDGYPSHMGLTLHQNYGTVDLVNELLDKGDASLIELNGESEHYMHSEGGHDADLMTLDHFTNHFLERYNYIAMPQEDGTVEWIVCEPPNNSYGNPEHPRRSSVQFELVVNELLKNSDYPNLSTDELQILYMDRDRIERISPSVLGTAYQAAVQSLNLDPRVEGIHKGHGTRMKVMADKCPIAR